MSTNIRVTVWGENVHEHTSEIVKNIYPKGMHECIADGIREETGFDVKTATLQQPDHGLTEEILNQTDVLTWWGHKAHNDVSDAIVERVYKRVHQGMGLVVLHSGHFSKIFKKLMGTPCDLQWREAGEKERIWICNPYHPITQGLPKYFELQNEEMYGEPYGIPTPEELIFISWFEGGEVFRSGCTWTRGQGKIFYFRPGHESYPTYHDANVRKVIRNGIRWTAPIGPAWERGKMHVPIESAPERITVEGQKVNNK